MDSVLTVCLIGALICVIGLVATAITRPRSTAPLLGWAALLAAVIGLYLTGILSLLVQAGNSIWVFLNGGKFDHLATIGFVLLVLAFVLWIASVVVYRRGGRAPASTRERRVGWRRRRD